jgi:hypothetical protein
VQGLVGRVRLVQGVPVPFRKLLPREYSGPRHIVSVGKRPDGRCEYEESPGKPPPNHAEDPGPQRDANLLCAGTGERQ